MLPACGGDGGRSVVILGGAVLLLEADRTFSQTMLGLMSNDRTQHERAAVLETMIGTTSIPTEDLASAASDHRSNDRMQLERAAAAEDQQALL